MYMTDRFLSQENTDLLWEVLLENENVPKTNHTRDTFARVLPEFNKAQNDPSLNLMGMNKLFMHQIMQSLGAGSSEKTENLVTHEEIQKHRKSEFEREFDRKQSEFMDGISKSVPEMPNFKDDAKDVPISNMNDTIQQMIAERKLDISKFSSSKKEAEKWLHLPESSDKGEASANTSAPVTSATPVQEVKEVKFIKIDDQEMSVDVPTINLDNTHSQKKVTWGEYERDEIDASHSLTANTLFSKLKRSDSANVQPDLSEEGIENDDVSYATSKEIDALRGYIESRFNQIEQLLIRQKRS